ncbi:MAG: penicillin-binding protein, partial [Novosphingobium sp.]|nr:penicillin-binding protein [Novosphingobium sp.]
MPLEELPDPLAPETPPPKDETPEGEAPRRRRWPLVLYSVAGLLAITILWLVITAPLSRALEPLADPALLLLDDSGRPIALRGAIKEAPVDV